MRNLPLLEEETRPKHCTKQVCSDPETSLIFELELQLFLCNKSDLRNEDQIPGRVHLLLESNLGTETVKTVPNPTRFPKVFGEELIVPEEILNGTVRRASFTTQESIKEELNNKDDLMDIGVLSSLPIFQGDAKNPQAVPQRENPSIESALQSAAESFISQGMPDESEVVKVRNAIEKRGGLAEKIANTSGGQEFLDSLK